MTGGQVDKVPSTEVAVPSMELVEMFAPELLQALDDAVGNALALSGEGSVELSFARVFGFLVRGTFGEFVPMAGEWMAGDEAALMNVAVEAGENRDSWKGVRVQDLERELGQRAGARNLLDRWRLEAQVMVDEVACQLLDRGVRPVRVAELLGVTRQAVSKRYRRVRGEGQWFWVPPELPLPTVELGELDEQT